MAGKFDQFALDSSDSSQASRSLERETSAPTQSRQDASVAQGSTVSNVPPTKATSDAPRSSSYRSTGNSNQSAGQRGVRIPLFRGAGSTMPPRDQVSNTAAGNGLGVATLAPEKMEGGETQWVLSTGSAATGSRVIVGAPPARLSRRVEEYMRERRKAVEADTVSREEVQKRVDKNQPRDYPPSYYKESPSEKGTTEWMERSYDRSKWCSGARSRVGQLDLKPGAEKLTRTLQPIQLPHGSSCKCIVEESTEENDGKAQLGNEAFAESCGKFLHLQPIPLARAEIPELADYVPSVNASETSRSDAAHQRGLATLGGIWCTVDGLRHDGRHTTPKDIKPPRRVMRVCGGQPIGKAFDVGEGRLFNARCYELLLFPQESISPGAVNYGAEGITLGQIVPPPASSFPLTPRLITDPLMLREYRKKLLAVKQPDSVQENLRDDRLTFGSTNGGSEATTEGQKGDRSDEKSFITYTVASVNPNAKFTVDLSVVVLPYIEVASEGGRSIVKVPRFCQQTVIKNRRLYGVSLQFSTRPAFIAAYKALLWATECNIVDIHFLPSSNVPDVGYAVLRVAATTSPLGMLTNFIDSTRASEGETSDKVRQEYQSRCLDFTVLNLLKDREEGHDSLRLSDFLVEAENETKRKSTIFSNTLTDGRQEDIAFADCKDATVVAYVPFGVIRRAISQKTNNAYDVRVVPRNKMRVLSIYSPCDKAKQQRNPDEIESERVDRDVEAAILLEYISRFPAISPVYAVILDEQRYYIFQEPWVSSLMMEKQFRSALGRNPSMEHNEQLKHISENTVMMTLKDFIHAILHKKSKSFEFMEAKLEFSQLLISELLLLLIAIHGKGILLGPCPPQRIILRIETSLKDDTVGSEENSASRPQITSRHIQLFIPDLGVTSQAWAYERQQCGVLEYLSPFYILQVMHEDILGSESSHWTVRDDWWTFLCLSFEILAFDGSPLLSPGSTSKGPSPTPLISKFEAPENILDVWRSIIGTDLGISQGIREYVHKRVLSAVAPEVDSWISTKVEELNYFATTGEHKRPPGVPQESQKEREGYIGVSLSTVYGQGYRSRSATPQEPVPAPPAGAENAVEETSFILYYRELFDSILKIVLPSNDMVCGIHSPALYFLSHPFFGSINLVEVFNGTWVLPPKSQEFFFKKMRKTKAEQAVSQYRRDAFCDPLTRRPEAPLLLGSTSTDGVGPFLLLSAAGQEDSTDVGSPKQYHTPLHSKPGPMYTQREREEIRQTEDQVRYALQHQGRDRTNPTTVLEEDEAPPSPKDSSKEPAGMYEHPDGCVVTPHCPAEKYSRNDPKPVPPKRETEMLQPERKPESVPLRYEKRPWTTPPRRTPEPYYTQRNEELYEKPPIYQPREEPPNSYQRQSERQYNQLERYPSISQGRSTKLPLERDSVERALNQMAAPSQTSICRNSMRNSIWPAGYIEGSIQRSSSRAASIYRERKNSACGPRTYPSSYYNEVLVPSDDD